MPSVKPETIVKLPQVRAAIASHVDTFGRHAPIDPLNALAFCVLMVIDVFADEVLAELSDDGPA